MEYWNLYDYDKKKKDKMAIRGSKLDDDDFHLVVNAWIINDKNEFLITQRSSKKSHPLMWECTGGSALFNENSVDAAVREVKEELGIDVDKNEAVFIGTTRRYYKNCPDILDVWLFKSNVLIDDVIIQQEEVNDVMWASKEKIIDLFKAGKFEANAFFNRIINYDDNIDFYYVGFNACNAICNENFFSGMITLNPNNEKGNIYYTNEYIKNKDEQFLLNYKNFLLDNMKKLSDKNENTIFLAFNKKIENLINNNKDFNIISEYNKDLINNLNDKKYTRGLFKKELNVINTKWVDKKISYEEAVKMIGSNLFVMQGKSGSGGDDTFYVDSEEKFLKYSKLTDDNYFISKYIKHLPINTTIIMNDYNDIYLPSSIQLIELKDDKFKYVGADFIYYQLLDNKIKNKLNEYNKIIVNVLKKFNYKGILGVDYIVDEEDNIYFMEINPRFQSSSFMINNALKKYCYTSIGELHYLSITDNYVSNIYLKKIDGSFLNCYNSSDYDEFKYKKIIKNGYYKSNPQTYFRKVFNYSIIKNGNFEKREKDK